MNPLSPDLSGSNARCKGLATGAREGDRARFGKVNVVRCGSHFFAFFFRDVGGGDSGERGGYRVEEGSSHGKINPALRRDENGVSRTHQ